MALVILSSVFLGFARSYFLAGIWKAELPNRLVHIHGAVFTTWILLLIAQVSLVSTGRVQWHRRLGMAGALVAAAMVVLGVMAAMDALARGFSPPGSQMDAATFYAFPLLQVVVFAALIVAAFRARFNAAAHKRLMLISTIAVIGPAVNRWPFAIMHRLPIITVAVLVGLVLLQVGFDLWTRHGVHRATLWGGLAILTSQLFLFPIGQSGAWHTFARWSVRVWAAL
jgi:hypothetical protein